ncbi:MAG TPA: TetR/AcrR family transcriptional regulator [Candidatus Binatia bacterium]
MSADRSPLVRLDGRLARSERSRRAVVTALLDLLEGGNVRPTAAQIAQRAGVSLRSVFQHFESIETLFAAAADLQMERLAPLLVPTPASGELGERIAMLVARRSRLLEAITPVRRASLRVEPFSKEVSTRLEAARARARAEVERVFAQELDARPAAQRRELAAALGAAASWSVWENLRRHQGLSVERARKVMTLMLTALLSGEAAAPTRRRGARSRNGVGEPSAA